MLRRLAPWHWGLLCAVVLAAVVLAQVVSHQRAVARSEALVADVQQILGRTRHPVVGSVDGDLITLTGVFDTADEQSSALTALSELDGAGVVTDQTSVLLLGDPYHLRLQIGDAGLSVDGMVPDDAAREVLRARFGDSADGLERRGGAPEGWPLIMAQAADALAFLRAGVVTVEGTAMTVSGRVATLDDRDRLRAMARTPAVAGLGITVDVTVADDGRPLSLSVGFNGTGLTLAGKVPQQHLPDILARARQIGDVNGAPSAVSQTGIEGLWPDIAFAVLDVLELLDEGAVLLEGNVVHVSGTASPEVRDDILARLQVFDGITTRVDITE